MAAHSSTIEFGRGAGRVVTMAGGGGAAVASRIGSQRPVRSEGAAPAPQRHTPPTHEEPPTHESRAPATAKTRVTRTANCLFMFGLSEARAAVHQSGVFDKILVPNWQPLRTSDSLVSQSMVLLWLV